MADFYGKMKAEKALMRAKIAAALGGGVRPKYKVLEIDMLKPQDLEMAAGVATFIHSSADAHKLAEHQNFSYRDLDQHRGRVGAVCYRGVEIALLFRRQVVEREPGPADPVPERILSAPDDEWIQVPLTNASKVVEMKGLSDRLRAVMSESERRRILWQDEVTKVKHLELELEKFKKGQQELVTLRERTALQEAQIKASEQENERIRTEVKQEKIGRREDKINIMRELIPAFNTTWLAGLHRAGDTLYEMVRQQMTKGLAAVGIELVEPKVGDGFDPQLHHAVHSYELPAGDPKIEAVVQVHRVGWKLVNGPLIEPADVAVGVEKRESENAQLQGTDTSLRAGE